jgi:glucosamine--fructose-6-phosphate aminotransferase (isomerizing)
LLALLLGRIRNLSSVQGIEVISALESLPDLARQILDQSGHIEKLAEKYVEASGFLFFGRQYNYPIALEGALKLKELSYIHAEGYPAGEMKHGPNALIDEDLPVVFLATYDEAYPDSRTRYEKVLNNVKEVKSRDGILVSLGLEDDTELQENSDQYIVIPKTNEFLLPILEAIPLQLLAYHIADRRGCDVDQPRNLAKSVTVE